MIGFSFLFLAVLGLLLAWLSPLAPVTIFLDWPNLIVFVVLLGLTIAMTKSWGIFKEACKALSSKHHRISAPNRKKAVALFELLIKTTWGIALIVVVSGFCMILCYLDDPAALGPNVSVAILGLLYGVLINVAFFYPAVYVLKHREDNDVLPEAAEPAAMPEVNGAPAV